MRRMPHGKSLTVEQNIRVRAEVKKLLEQYGSQGALAKELGLTQAGLSAFINEKNGAGMQLVDAVARKLRTTRDQLLDGEPAQTTRGPTVADLPGWATAFAKAREFSTRPQWVWQKTSALADLAPPNDGEVTVDWILELAAFVHRNTPHAEQLERSRAAINSTIKGIETRAKNRIRSK